MKRLFLILAISVVPLAGCATTPKPCTQEWVDYKTDRILRKFASENRVIINDLRRLTNAEGDLNTFATIQLMSRADDLQRFADSFQTIVLPELQQAVDECGRSEEFVPALTSFLREEGVSEDALEWVAPIIGLMQDMRDDVGNRSQSM